jgi:hypothetical protein
MESDKEKKERKNKAEDKEKRNPFKKFMKNG